MVSPKASDPKPGLLKDFCDVPRSSAGPKADLEDHAVRPPASFSGTNQPRSPSLVRQSR